MGRNRSLLQKQGCAAPGGSRLALLFCPGQPGTGRKLGGDFLPHELPSPEQDFTDWK